MALHRIFSTQEDSSQNFQHSGGLFTEFSISRTIRFFLDLGFLYLLTYLVYSDIWRENVLSPSSVILKIEAVSPFETPKQTKHTATSRNSKFCPPLKATSVSMQLFFTVKRKVQKWLATSTPDAANIQDSTELYKASCICVWIFPNSHLLVKQKSKCGKKHRPTWYWRAMSKGKGGLSLLIHAAPRDWRKQVWKYTLFP